MDAFPEDWKVNTIGTLFEVGSSKRVFQSQWRKSGVPFYRARDIVGFNRGAGAIGGLYIDKELYEEYKRSYGVPLKGDILITAVGTLGETYLVEDDHPFYFKDGNIIWLRSLGTCDSRFVQYLYSSGSLDDQIFDTTGGSTVGTYTISNVKKTKVHLPPLPEQRRIAAALGDMDKLVDNLSKRIEKNKAIKQGAMQELLTGKKRLPGFEGEWEKVELLGVTRMFSDGDWIESKDQCDCGIRLIQTGNVGCGCFKNKGDKKHFVSEETFSRLNCTEIVVGDVLVSRLPDPIGRACLLPKANERMITAVDCTIIRFAEYSAEFFVQYTQTPEYLWSVGSFMAGSTRQRISREALGKVKIPSPTLPEQRAIAKVLGDMDAEIAKLEAKREKLIGIKKGMMSDLLTGKVRLKSANEA